MRALQLLLLTLCSTHIVLTYSASNYIPTFDDWLLEHYDESNKPEEYRPSYVQNDLNYLLSKILTDDSDNYYGGAATTELPHDIQEMAPVVGRQPEASSDLLNRGFQAMSGGAGEGLQQLLSDGSMPNQQEVKSDANLPSYCSPPNPCPKGLTAVDGCMEHVLDTVEFNRRYIIRLMMEGFCSCDEEHMRPESCPSSTMQDSDGDWMDIDSYLDYMIKSDGGAKSQNPFISVGAKRESLSVKKGLDLSMR